MHVSLKFLIENNKDKYKVAKRILSLKKKTKLMDMLSKLLNNLESVS